MRIVRKPTKKCGRNNGVMGGVHSLPNFPFFAFGNIKNTSRLLAEEEEKDVDVWIFG